MDDGPGAGKSGHGVDLVEVVGSLDEAILTLLEVFVDPGNVHSVLDRQSLRIIALLVKQGEGEGGRLRNLGDLVERIQRDHVKLVNDRLDVFHRLVLWVHVDGVPNLELNLESLL